MTALCADRPPAVPVARRAGVGLLVLVGHALLAAGLVTALRPGPVLLQVDAPQPLLWLRLPRAPEQAAAAVETARTSVARPPREPDRAPLPVAPPAVAPRAITLPASDAAGLADVASSANAALAAETPASRPAPLDLSLPRQPPAGWARDETRLPAPVTRDERLARALGTDTTLREQARGERRRFVRGRDCVDTRPARIGQLDPFNQSTHPSPRLAEPC